MMPNGRGSLEAIAQLNEHEQETLFKAGEIIRRLAESEKE